MKTEDVTGAVKRLALAAGADLVGVAPVERFAAAPAGRRPSDHLPTARSVVVIAKHIPDAAVDRWGKPPARSITSYRTYGHGPLNIRLIFMAQDVCAYLEQQGYDAYPVTPLGGQSMLVSPATREFFAEFSNRHAAVAAGLGQFGWSSLAMSPEFGPRQRFVSIITDAPLEASPLYSGPDLCAACYEKHTMHPCAAACPMEAISQREGVEPITIGDRTFSYGRVDHWRCYWSEVEGLIKEAGPMYAGLTTDVRPPATVTPEAILAAKGQKDPWQVAGSYELIGPWCGRCLQVCTYGQEAHAGRLRRRPA